MKYIPLLASALLAAIPAMMLVSGCSGGNGGIVTPTAIPTSTSTATPLPTATSLPQQTLNLTLGNGQPAILKYTTNGTTINGSLQILPTTSSAIKTRALTYRFAVGTYVITGTFTPPRGYNISGAFNGQPLFTMTGQLPTTTQTGTYTLTVDGQTESGTLPRIGDVTPTATPLPTATPTSSGGTITSTVTFTRSSDSNFVDVPITPSLNVVTAGGTQNLSAGGQGANNAGSTFLTVSLPNTVAGKTYGFNEIFTGAQALFTNTPGNTIPFYYKVQSGTVTVNSFTATTASVTFNNIVFVPNEGTGNGTAKGTVTLKGTISGPFKKAN